MRTVEKINNEINELKDRLALVQGTDTEVYTRIVGYYRPVKNWNKGKRDEYNHRKLFSQPVRTSNGEAELTAVFTEASDNLSEPRQEVLFDRMNKPAGYTYFYRTSCSNCPPVKSWLENFYLEGDAVNVDEKEGFEKASAYQIYVSPTVIFHDENGAEMYRATNVNSLNSLFAKVTV